VLLGASVFVALAILSLSLYIKNREAATQRDQARAQQQRSESITSFILNVFDLGSPFNSGKGDLTVPELLDKATLEAEKGLTQQPEQQVTILSLLAYIYQDLGQNDKAEQLSQESLERGLSRLPRNNQSLADAFFSRGTVKAAASEYPQAEDFHRKALEIRRRALGEGHRDYATSMYSLGAVLFAQGKNAQAEPLYRESLRLRRSHTPPHYEDIIRSMSALALLLERTQRYQESERLYREALGLSQKYMGPQHPTVGTILDDFAQLLTNTGRFKEAEKLHRQALHISQLSLGEGHPNVISRIYNLGFLLSFQNRDAEAESLYREALRRSRQFLGEEHEYSIVIAANLARLLSKQKKFEEALALLSEARTKAVAALGDRHPLVTRLDRHTAHVLYESGNISAAETRARKVIDLLTQDPDSNPAELAAVKSLLADCLIARRDFEEAEQLALEWYKAAPPREQSDAVNQLARIYEGWGKRDKAAEYRKQLADLKKKWEAQQPVRR
jgi:tetratricopeptide (TPR) repeat protein